MESKSPHGISLHHDRLSLHYCLHSLKTGYLGSIRPLDQSPAPCPLLAAGQPLRERSAPWPGSYLVIMYLWQHPHFYAISWMCKDDYAQADFKMLPVIEPDGSRTIRQIFWHLLLMIPVSLLPVVEGSLGKIYLIGVTIISCAFFSIRHSHGER